MAKRIKVLCVDDRDDTVSLCARMIDAEPDMQCVGMLLSADDLLREVKRLRPDVLVLDLKMPGCPPFEALQNVIINGAIDGGGLTDLGPRTVFFSGYADNENIRAAINAGAWGFVSKTSQPTALIECIRRVSQGKTCFPTSSISLPPRTQPR